MLHFQLANKIWRKKAMVMKISSRVQNCGASTKMPKNQKNNFGNILKIFFENWQNAAVKRRFLKNIFKMFLKLFFRFFGIFLLGKIFITIAFFLHSFFTIWKLEVFCILLIFEKYFNNFWKIFWKCSQNYFSIFLAFLYSGSNSVQVKKNS